jgi:hypothetical protein
MAGMPIVPTQLYKFALHSDESTLPLAMVEMNLVHLLERNSGSAQFSPASNTTERSKKPGLASTKQR